MRYLDEFRDPRLAEAMLKRIVAECDRPLRFMEVCGTHTVAIFRSGIRQLLPPQISLLSGPGCPVCVTSQHDIDYAIELAGQPGVILATYGDMMKVAGTRSSLMQERAAGRDVRVVYSAADAVQLAADNPGRQVIFLGVGFETTAPTAALSVLEAAERGLRNYRMFSVHKVIGPPLRALLNSGEVQLHGFILPGHVSTIIGTSPYQFLVSEYSMPGVITGFEPLDILQSVHMLITQVANGRPSIEIQYRRAVRTEGNTAAQAIMEKVFAPVDAVWRGLGLIPQSGLRLREEYAEFDAERAYAVDVSYSREPKGCRCGEVLRGVVSPKQCPLFADTCTPEHAIGPCMVSSEGTCAAYYRYGR